MLGKESIMSIRWLRATSLAVFAMCAFSSAASAGLIVDTVYQNTYVDWWNTTSYTHDLNDNLNQTGTFTLGTAVSGTLSVDVSDDGGIFDSWETVLFTVENFDFDTGGLTFGSGFHNSLEIQAIAAINATGLLDVKVTSLWGDFYLGNSVLTLQTGTGAAASVVEPTSVALLVLGLLGLGVLRRSTQHTS